MAFQRFKAPGVETLIWLLVYMQPLRTTWSFITILTLTSVVEGMDLLGALTHHIHHHLALTTREMVNREPDYANGQLYHCHDTEVLVPTLTHYPTQFQVFGPFPKPRLSALDSA